MPNDLFLFSASIFFPRKRRRLSTEPIWLQHVDYPFVRPRREVGLSGLQSQRLPRKYIVGQRPKIVTPCA